MSHDSIRGCVRPSVRRSIRPSVGRKREFSAGGDKTANDLFRVYELVYVNFEKNKACTKQRSPTNQRPSRIFLTNQRPERERASQKNMRSALRARPSQSQSKDNY